MQQAPVFHGATYVPERDQKRLTTQYFKIKELMADCCWRTLTEISNATGAPEASASACLRGFRKPRNGSHEVERMYVGNGLFKYRVIFNTKQ